MRAPASLTAIAPRVEVDAIFLDAHRHPAPQVGIEPQVARQADAVGNVARLRRQHGDQAAGIQRHVAGVLENRFDAPAATRARYPAADRLCSHRIRRRPYYAARAFNASFEFDTQPKMPPCALIIASPAFWNSGK